MVWLGLRVGWVNSVINQVTFIYKVLNIQIVSKQLYRHKKVTVTVNFCTLFTPKWGFVTVHTAGRDEEHADEEVLQNNSL